jgi:DNA-binding Lrp family transcriptional regulator
MLRGINKNTDDYIVEFLAEGGYSGKKIVNHLNDIKSISKQSVYERIRKLVDQKIILKIKTKYYLNNAWVDSVRQLFDSFNTPLIKEGESISYTFNNLYQLDAY